MHFCSVRVWLVADGLQCCKGVKISLAQMLGINMRNFAQKLVV